MPKILRPEERRDRQEGERGQEHELQPDIRREHEPPDRRGSRGANVVAPVLCRGDERGDERQAEGEIAHIVHMAADKLGVDGRDRGNRRERGRSAARR